MYYYVYVVVPSGICIQRRATLLTIDMHHILELLGNYPVLPVLMLIYCYVERIGEFLLPPIFCITDMIMKNIIQVNHLIYI